MRALLFTILVCLVAPPVAADESQGPLITHAKYVFRGVKAILIRAAESMPEEKYAFKPTDAVRTFGQIVGHVADTNYYFCSLAAGVKNPRPGVEKSKTAKSDLVAALKEAFAHCDSAYASLSDTSAEEIVKLMGSDAPRLGVLNVNSVHTIEHYGNLVTYLRMNHIVPPTSDQEFMKQLSQP